MSGLKGPKPKPLADTGPSLKDLDEPLPFEGTALLETGYQGRYYMPPRAEEYRTYTTEALRALAAIKAPVPPAPSPSPTCDLGNGLTISLGFRVISAYIDPYYGPFYGPAHAGMLLVTFETPCRDTGKLLTLDFREPLPTGYKEMSPTDKATWVKRALRILCMHEVCEGIKVDGIRIFDPHLYPEAVK